MLPCDGAGVSDKIQGLVSNVSCEMRRIDALRGSGCGVVDVELGYK